jgi:TatD DNase family protein
MTGEPIPLHTKNCFFSYGIHPWQLETQKKDALIAVFEQEIASNVFVAIGETGIDKARKISLELQTEVFEYQIHIAKQKQLPVILHVVKAIDEIVQSVSKIKPNVPMILHAFNGTKEQIALLSKKGFYFSVGSAINNPDSKIAIALKTIPKDRLFFETDTNRQDIALVYTKAAELLNMPFETLQQTVFENFKRCFPFAEIDFKML